jgi:hypothetical protein
MIIAAAIALFVATQAPPPPPTTTTTAPIDPSVAPEAPPADAYPPAIPPAPDANKPLPTAPPPKAEPHGMGAFGTGALQYATGCGIAALSLPCNFCSLGLWGCTVEPALIGYGETWVGDGLGQNRDAAIWPMLTAYGVGIVGFLVNIGILVAVAGGSSIASNAGASALTNASGLVVQGATTAATLVLLAAIPVVYNFTSVPKQPGDDGSGTPGLLEPSTGSAPPAPKTSVEVKPASYAMAF